MRILLFLMLLVLTSCSEYSQSSMNGSIWFRTQTYNWEILPQDTVWQPERVEIAHAEDKQYRILAHKSPRPIPQFIYDPKYIRPWDWRLDK